MFKKLVTVVLSFILILTSIVLVKPTEVKAYGIDGIMVSKTTSSITVNWQNAIPSDETYSDFQIYLSRNFDDVILDAYYPSNTYTHTFTGLDAGTYYSIQIKGTIVYDNGSTSTDYAIASFRTVTTPTKVKHINQDKWWLWAESCDVSWDKQDGCMYEVNVKDSKGKVISHNIDQYVNNYTFPVKNNQIYKVQVRAITNESYNEVGGVEKSEWSDVCYCFTQPMIKGVSYNKKGAMQLSFNKIKGVTSYEVYMSTKEKKGYKKVKSLKGNYLTISKFKGKKISKSKKYYVYIVAKKKVGSKTYTSGRHYTTTIKNRMTNTNWTF